VVIDLALDVNLLDDTTPGQKANQLFYLTRASLKRRQIDEVWKAKAATSPKSLTRALLSSTVGDAIRKELRRATGHNVDQAEISRLLRETVVRPECL
jgi:hypothetical protein